LKDGSELAEVTTGGRLFHTREAAIPNAGSLMVRSLVRGTLSLRERTPTLWRQTTSYMPNVLTAPTNVSSPILDAGPSAPSATSAYPTALDVIAEQPTSQMNEPDVTPNLFSPTTPELTIIPETPMDGTPALQSAQLSSHRLPSERKTREDSPTHRRSQHTQSRLDDRTKVTSKLTTFEESEDEDNDEEPTNIVGSLSRSSLKDMPRSKDRRETRTNSEDPTRRHRKKTGFWGAPSSDKLSSSAKDNADMVRPTYLETFYIQIDQFAYLRGTLLVGQYDYEVVHRRSKQHANADVLSCRPTQTVKLSIQSVADDQQVQQPAQVRAVQNTDGSE